MFPRSRFCFTNEFCFWGSCRLGAGGVNLTLAPPPFSTQVVNLPTWFPLLPTATCRLLLLALEKFHRSMEAGRNVDAAMRRQLQVRGRAAAFTPTATQTPVHTMKTATSPLAAAVSPDGTLSQDDSSSIAPSVTGLPTAPHTEWWYV